MSGGGRFTILEPGASALLVFVSSHPEALISLPVGGAREILEHCCGARKPATPLPPNPVD
jgi:hypothetical protein